MARHDHTPAGSRGIASARATRVEGGLAIAESTHFSQAVVGSACEGDDCCDQANGQLDVLLMVDSSGSMAEEQAALAAQIPRLARALATGDANGDGVQDFPALESVRFGVVSSDMGTGSDFVPGATTVTVDGVDVPASDVTVVSTTELTYVAPAHAAGPVEVTVTTVAGTSNPLTYTYLDTPTASSLDPSSGPVAGGQLVTVTGTGFVVGGTTVTVDGSTTQLANGSATWQITAPRAASNATITIKDANGSVVQTVKQSLNAGAQSFSWNGTSSTGTLASDGAYTITIDATDASGQAVACTTDATGVVDSVDVSGGTPVLHIGTLSVSADKVKSIARTS